MICYSYTPCYPSLFSPIIGLLSLFWSGYHCSNFKFIHGVDNNFLSRVPNASFRRHSRRRVHRRRPYWWGHHCRRSQQTAAADTSSPCTSTTRHGCHHHRPARRVQRTQVWQPRCEKTFASHRQASNAAPGPISDTLVRNAYVAAYDRRLRHPSWVSAQSSPTLRGSHVDL